jgi:hypothetical protein
MSWVNPELSVHLGRATKQQEWDQQHRRAKALEMRAPLRECPDARTGNARDAANSLYRTFLKTPLQAEGMCSSKFFTAA